VSKSCSEGKLRTAKGERDKAPDENETPEEKNGLLR
jgi:hypothetical protein